MAEVWSATHELLGAVVAIKLLHSGGPRQQHRLLREGRVQRALDHPNILPVRDIIDVDGVLGLVMPLIEGPTLAELLATQSLSEAEAISVLRPVVAGVAHAHARELVHRDLKPANILLERRAGWLVPRVSDFGLVRDRSDPHGTRTGAIMGTLCYAAPEQLLDASSVDARADLFSLGVILVELLSGGQRPFEADSLRTLLSAYDAGPRLDAVPERWAPLCRSLLADADARLPSCSALLDALDALQPPTPALLGPDSALAEAAARLWSSTGQPHTRSTMFSAVDSLDTPSVLIPMVHNLPPALDAFIGRQADLDRLSARLTSSRLVSVLGPGGVGKTRLVQELARQTRADFPGGVWYCDLSEARSAEQLVATVAQSMGVVLAHSAPQARLGRAIAGRGRCLIVLDNFEQLVACGASAVTDWVRQAPQARLVVTSQVLLGVPGEASLTLAPLGEEAGVALFTARAQGRRPGLVLSDSQAAIAELVRLLDGLPLAIELAAARIAVMRPEKMVARMGARFRLLRGRGGVTRQATLRGAIDWSWSLLEGWERAAFAQCSVFEGSFSLEAAEQVLDLSGFEDEAGGVPWPMDAVQGLVERSLLSIDHSAEGDEARFRMLLSLQAYASEKLELSGTVAEARARHARCYAALGADAALAAVTRRGGEPQWWALIHDRANLEAAARRALGLGVPAVAARAALALAAVARQQGPYEETCAALASAGVRLADDDAELRAAVRTDLAGLRLLQGDTDAAGAALAQALDDAKRAPNRAREVDARLGLSGLCAQQGRLDEAAQHLQVAHDIAAHIGERQLLGRALAHRCSLHSIRGDAAAAAADGAQARDIFSAIGDRRAEGVVLRSLANLHARRGRLERAEALHQRALVIHRETGSRQHEAAVLCSLGPIYTMTSRSDEAAQVLGRAHRIALALGSRNLEARTLGFMGSLYRKLGQIERAEGCLQGALAIHRETGNRRSLAIWLGNLGNLYVVAGRLDEAGASYREGADIAAAIGVPSVECNILGNLSELLTRQGRHAAAEQTFRRALDLARASDNRINEALILGNLGGLYAQQGRLEEARAHFVESLAQHRAIGNRSSEATVLRSLGGLACQRERWQEAAAHFHSALAIAEQIEEPDLEGALLGDLGTLHARQGDIEAGRALLQRGEDRLRSLDNLTLLAVLLAHRAELEHRAGSSAAATYLQQARELIDKLGLGPSSPAAQRLAHIDLA